MFVSGLEAFQVSITGSFCMAAPTNGHLEPLKFACERGHEKGVQ